jgi:hypothetical protein
MRNTMAWVVAAGLVSACSFDELELDTGTTQQASTTVTRIHVNGRFADVLLDEGDSTNGFLNASKDQLANTTGLDFGYAEPHPTDPDIAVIIQGSGQIPNGSFSVNGQAAALHVTTAFPISRCEVNQVTGEFTCGDGTAIRFDLSWVNDDFGDIQEKTKRKQVFGPVTTRFEGEFKQRTASINGTWTGHTGVDMSGNLLQTVNTTITREITMEASP